MGNKLSSLEVKCLNWSLYLLSNKWMNFFVRKKCSIVIETDGVMVDCTSIFAYLFKLVLSSFSVVLENGSSFNDFSWIYISLAFGVANKSMLCKRAVNQSFWCAGLWNIDCFKFDQLVGSNIDIYFGLQDLLPAPLQIQKCRWSQRWRNFLCFFFFKSWTFIFNFEWLLQEGLWSS